MSTSHDLFWASLFGLAVADLLETGVCVVPHVGLAGYQGVWFFLRGARLVVSAPEPWVACLRMDLAETVPELPSPATVSRVFGPSLGRSIGPAFHGALDASTLRRAQAAGVRPLAESDSQAVAAFRSACGSDDWDDSGLDEASLYRAACFEGGSICAMAGFRPWSRIAGDPCVLTHPKRRGAGLATRVVSTVLSTALADGQVVLYQTLEANLPAVRLALSLGYTRYASHIAVRLNSARPSN